MQLLCNIERTDLKYKSLKQMASNVILLLAQQGTALTLRRHEYGFARQRQKPNALAAATGLHSRTKTHLHARIHLNVRAKKCIKYGY
jgi:hypothetical protein